MEKAGQAGIGFAFVKEIACYMNLQQFRSSSRFAQENIIKQQGVFLFERRALGVNVYLYQIDGFYAEVFYDAETSKVTFIKSFRDIDGIETYLERIDISSLLAAL